MRLTSATLTAATVLCITGAPAFAHHSISGAYFMDQREKIDGNVVEFDYRNPHSVILIESRDPKSGEVTKWDVEWSSVRRLEGEGVTKDVLKPGDHVLVIGYPSRTPGDHGIHVTGIQRPADGWKWGKPVE